ncbi:MAG: DUF177 domain-containing protein [Kofleriaceae bacterium]|nr:DUF177 domain-containing protein [Kofleriaceae bacterium]
MAKLPPYAVLLRDIPVKRQFTVPGELVSEWVKGLPMRDALGAPAIDPDAGHGDADLELYSEGSHVFAAGAFKGHLNVACSRCVGNVRLEIDDRVRVTFMPKHEMPAEAAPAEGEEGAEVSEEDLDLFPYEGEYIDLEPLFREEFVLAIPYAPLCREDCKGLCPQCGADLNSGTCTCEKPIDPRLAALKGLKLPS